MRFRAKTHNNEVNLRKCGNMLAFLNPHDVRYNVVLVWKLLLSHCSAHIRPLLHSILPIPVLQTEKKGPTLLLAHGAELTASQIDVLLPFL